VHPYRSHTCGELALANTGTTVRLSGWLHRKRDHGGLLFLDLRDHHGITQCVITPDSPHFETAQATRLESVVTVTGPVVERAPETVNEKIPTGRVEVRIEDLSLLSPAIVLPFEVNTETEYPEDTRLRYRFLDLRREQMHQRVVLRSAIIESIRRRMREQGFLEMQTPILTSTSPEGARDFLVPSSVYPGSFYALPQAPQIFKQLIMVSGFDRYFQIAPCFRDEASRADRTPGEFYQLDLEMAFVTQEDVFDAIEPVLHGVFAEFSNREVTALPFPRIPHAEAMLKYGSDKPDLRNPLEICDVTEVFADSDFRVFRGAIEKGAVVRAIPAPGAEQKPRSFFDQMIEYAQKKLGAQGLAYLVFGEGASGKGPVAKFLDAEKIAELARRAGVGPGDALFFVCDVARKAAPLAGSVRTRLGELLDAIDQKPFRFCWVVDFPMYELDEESGEVVFSHNPFSMPQGGLEALETKDPLEIRAWQYDIVCNGVELSSGAIRNHLPEIMVKAFAIAGYDEKTVSERFGALHSAFQYGAPPHGGIAPGIDRIVMLLAETPNLREVIAFPFNQNARDLLMNAPAPVPDERLRELGLRHLPARKGRGRKET
jgi:aspartyl-tRNA synthetase